MFGGHDPKTSRKASIRCTHAIQHRSGGKKKKQIAHKHSQFLEQHSINPFEIYYEGEEKTINIFYWAVN